MGKSRKKHFIIRRIILGMLIIIIIAGGIYCRFGGFVIDIPGYEQPMEMFLIKGI